MIELLSDELWSVLKTQAKKNKRRSYVAVAYLSPGAFERLPLKPGSVLVVNCNEATVKGGQTDPREIKKYLEHGVQVHNVSNLHAKVFVLGSRAFVGSSNLSSSSENLLEAAIATRDRTVVRVCKLFVQSLAGEAITPTEADRLIPLFDPKRFKRQATRRPKHRRRRIVPQHNPLWAVRTFDIEWQEADYEAQEAGMPEAEDRLSSSDFKIDTFKWSGTGSAFFKGVRRRHVVLQVHEKSPRRVFLQPPQKVVFVKRYKKGKRMIVFLESKKRLRERPMTVIRSRLPTAAKLLSATRSARMIHDSQVVHDVQHLWGLD